MNKNRLVGGEFLLDLVMISFVASVDAETFTDITNQQVINQLTDLKTYIRNPKSIKPIWVRLQDNDDYIVARGELSKDKDSNVFVIRVKFKGQLLTINVEFTQMLNEDNQPLDDYYIDSGDAGYNLVSQNNLSSIVDNQGNYRFVEGNFTMDEIEGVTQTYGKWSLSGTHLMIVLCFDVNNGVEFTSSDDFASITNIPQWIMDKIVSVFGYGGIVRQAVNFYSKTTTASQSGAVILFKDTATKLIIHNSTGLTMSDDRAVRIAFDLLIDTDAPAEEQGD